MPRKQRWSKKLRTAFLRVLRETGNISAAARKTGVSLSTIYRKKATEPRFAREWQAALEEALDDLEAEVRRRALEGTEKPVYYGGKEVGTVRSYNDNLAMFLLKSRRGHIFGGNDDPQSGLNQENPIESPREKLLSKLKTMHSRVGKKAKPVK